MTTIRVIEPAAEPVSITEVKDALRINQSDNSQNGLLATLIQGVREMAEGELHRPLIDTTFEMYTDRFTDALKLDHPHARVAWVRYIDKDGVERTIDPQGYKVDGMDPVGPSWIKPARGRAWPSTAPEMNAVRVRYVAGFGTIAANVPAGIRTWMLMHLRTLEVASAMSERELKVLPSLASMIQPYVVY
jgi:uncharacterized phiE125 gp8 family phage protein